jgi:Transglutaminase-like superfamily
MKASGRVFAVLLLCIVAGSAPSRANEQESIPATALKVIGNATTVVDKTERLVNWINSTFEWTATDYQKRTPEEIIRRRGGNCAELASVLDTLLNSLNISHRWIAEINVQPESVEREYSSEELMSKIGNQASVFGLNHNDHRWLEVYDQSTQTWFPADPAVGVVGMKAWVGARLALDRRTPPPVPAVAEITKDMLIPFVVVARSSRNGSQVEDRSTHYLIDAFDSYYGEQLHQLPAWSEWVKLIHRLSASGASALEGSSNLHEQKKAIEELSIVYKELQHQALTHKLITSIAPLGW